MMWMAFIELGLIALLVGFVVWAVKRKPKP